MWILKYFVIHVQSVWKLKQPLLNLPLVQNFSRERYVTFENKFHLSWLHTSLLIHRNAARFLAKKSVRSSFRTKLKLKCFFRSYPSKGCSLTGQYEYRHWIKQMLILIVVWIAINIYVFYRYESFFRHTFRKLVLLKYLVESYFIQLCKLIRWIAASFHVTLERKLRVSNSKINSIFTKNWGIQKQIKTNNSMQSQSAALQSNDILLFALW